MRLAGEQRVAAPRQKVWEALNDPEILRQSIPGCQSLDKEADDRLAAVVEIKIGPIGARFKGAVTLSDLDPPNGYTITGQGNGGVAGNAKGSAKVRLSDDGAGGTLVSYDVDAEVGGRMAQLGGPIIDATAKQLAGKFFAKFGDVVAGGGAAPAEAVPAAATPASAPVAAAPAAVVAAPSSGSPIVWLLALAVAAFAGFFIGQSQGGVDSAWAGLAIGLLVIVVAGAAFEYGRRAAAPVMVLDSALLRRLIDGARE
jgi:carbon monoxide dehydrogenase subunit G